MLYVKKDFGSVSHRPYFSCITNDSNNAIVGWFAALPFQLDEVKTYLWVYVIDISDIIIIQLCVGFPILIIQLNVRFPILSHSIQGLAFLTVRLTIFNFIYA